MNGQAMDSAGWPLIVGARVRVTPSHVNGVSLASYMGTVSGFESDNNGTVVHVSCDGRRRHARPTQCTVRPKRRVKKEIIV